MFEVWDFQAVIHSTLLKIPKKIASTSAAEVVLKQTSHLRLNKENHQNIVHLIFPKNKTKKNAPACLGLFLQVTILQLQCYIPAKPINFRGRYFNENGTLSTIHSVFDTIVEIPGSVCVSPQYFHKSR